MNKLDTEEIVLKALNSAYNGNGKHNVVELEPIFEYLKKEHNLTKPHIIQILIKLNSDGKIRYPMHIAKKVRERYKLCTPEDEDCRDYNSAILLEQNS